MTARLVALLLALGLPSAAADETQVGPLLESLDGAPSARVRSADGQVHTVKPGDELAYGDQIATGTAAARVAYEDGAQVLLPAGTSAVFQKAELDLSDGEVRALVEPAQATPGAAPSPRPQTGHRFLIRTRSAVLGVRGTDFVVSAQGDQTAVHTLDGTVDLARDDTALKGGGAQSVPAGQFSEASAGRAPSPPARFDTASYLADFHKRHPRLERLHQAARRAVQNGSLRKRFQKLRSRPGLRGRPAQKRRFRRGPMKRKPPNSHEN